MSTECIFCEILAGNAPASFVYRDEGCAVFLTKHQVRRGELLVIPTAHIDDFVDMPDDLASHVLLVAQRMARALRANLDPDRIGYVVHGYGVAHAHLMVLPQHHIHDITSARFAEVEDGEVRFRESRLTIPSREELDRLATEIREWLGGAGL